MKKPSEKSLTNVALHALRKHSTSRQGLVQKLERKLVRSGEVGPAEAKLLIDQVVERMTQSGYLDDTRMAEAKTASLRRQAKSSRVIELKLREKGIDPALAKTLAITTPEVEFESACLLVKKKRLGSDPDRKQKDFAVLMRAGFSSDVARRALREAPGDPGEVAQVIHLPRAPTSLTSPEGHACKVLNLKLPSLPSRPRRPESGLEAARALVEKKHLGLDPGRKQRDLGVLVRAGFSFDIAKQALQRIGD